RCPGPSLSFVLVRKGASDSPRPRGEDEYPAEASLTTAEYSFDLSASHVIEIIGNRDVPFHETEAAHFGNYGCIQSRNLHHRFARFRDDEAFALYRLFDELRKMGFGLVDIDRFHNRLSLISLV